ncbi:MAG: class I tRNA ligase family protein, partial [Lachnospiraceae bacterium]|nr:class I tRNA ligase family protein [Lachnospiraceae bacterium]
KNVVVLGLVQDENGQKMSKHKGNVVDPMEVLDTIGADAIRWYFYWNSAPWLAKRFSREAVIEGRSKFLGTLWNTYAFYTLYADIDGFDPMKYLKNGKWEPEGLAVMDRWILSKLNSLILSVDRDLENYRITEAARAMQEFTDDLSNWYVRRGRSRYWAKGMETDKVNAYMTLFTCLKELSLLAAPMIPFMTEEIWQNIVRTVDPEAEESIHLAKYPVADESMIDPELEASMEHVLKLVVMGRAARNAAALKNRQPLREMIVKAPFTLEKYFDDVIADELNVKKLTFTDDVSTFTTYTFKPQLRTVGPKYGKALGAIRTHLNEMDGNAAMKELREKGSISFDANGTPVTLTEDDLLIDVSHKEGYVSENEGEATVVLDTTLTPELIEEGFVREIISKVQTMRKEADFNVTDRIAVRWQAEGQLREIFTKYADEIAKETLASGIKEGRGGYEKEWSLNGEHCTLGVEVTVPGSKAD